MVSKRHIKKLRKKILKKRRPFNYNNPVQVYWRILREAFLPNAWKFGVATLFMSLSSSSIAYRAYLIKPAIDKVFLDKDIDALMWIPIQLVLIAIATSITTFTQQYLMQKTTTNISISYQKKLFAKLVNVDYDFYTTRSSHKIMDLFNDVSGLLSAMRLILTNLIADFFTMIGLIAIMVYQNPKLAVVAFIGFPMVILPFRYITKRVKDLARKNQSLGGATNHVMGEAFTLIELVKSTANEEVEIEKFNKIAMTNYKLAMKSTRLNLISSPVMEMAGTIGFAGVLWLGGKQVIEGAMTSGAFFTMVTALLSIYKPAKSFSGINNQIQGALMAAKRLFLTLDMNPMVKDKKDAMVISNVYGNIEFKDVKFNYPIHDKDEPIIVENRVIKYDEKPALNGISLNIKRGQNVALVGHSGSGKSTTFKLIQRFYDVAEGRITIDGNDIRDITMNSLRNNISVVSQDVLLFNATIRDNIKYANPNATEEELKNACDSANATEFILQMPEGIDTMLGPNGTMLSGGQKQRVSIARAILKNSPILLLDEATSALDPISEKLIQKALHTLMKDKTTIIIAHRLSTIQNCDNIFVFKHGNLIEQGKHEELLSQEGHYAELYKKQFEKLDKTI